MNNKNNLFWIESGLYGFLGCLLLITTGMRIRSNFAYAQQQQEDPNSLGVTYSKC
jgi:hypothetical protein